MLPSPLSFGLLLSALVLLGSCSLVPFPPQVKVQVKLNGEVRAAERGTRSGPPLNTMNCFAVIVKGAPGALTDAQVADRSAACLGMDGAFNGPYSYSQIQSGVSLSLAAASYTFSLIGYFGVNDCGTGPSNLYNATTAAQNFAIGAPVAVNLATASAVSVDGGLYVPANATDRTASCPVQSLTCAGAEICDSFTGPEGASLTGHIPDIGTSWEMSNLNGPVLMNNSVTLSSLSNAGGLGSIFQLASRVHMTATLRGTFGQAATQASIGIILRYGDAGNYAIGSYFRTDGTSLCGLNIDEYSNGTHIPITTIYETYPEKCPWGEVVTLTFSYDGGVYNLRRGDLSGLGTPSAPGLSGQKVGIGTGHFGSEILVPRADFFKASPLP